MRLWLWSDIHLEQQQVTFPRTAPRGADVIVCAGDLCSANMLHETVHEIVSLYRMPLLMVPGNHEYYSDAASGRSVEQDRVFMKSVAEASKAWPARLHLLDDDTLQIGDVRFVGGTLWTDFAAGASTLSDIAWRMNDAVSDSPDFMRISGLTPQGMLDMNRWTSAYIRAELRKPFRGTTIVVTHHPPHQDAVPRAYAGMKSNYLFANHDNAFGGILNSELAPFLWVCGHTHHPIDISVGRTRIVCNPHGFSASADERENGFRWDFVIDTDEGRGSQREA